nr:DMT family transporter [Halovivax asiaticus]
MAAAALWGGLYVVSKWGFDAVPPVTLAFCRIAVGAATLLVVVRYAAPKRRFSRADVRGFVALGTVVAASIVTQFLGTAMTTASQGSLVTVLTPVFTILLGVSVLGERLSRRLGLGIVLATLGTGIVLYGQHDASTLRSGGVSGVGMLLLASATWAAYTVWGKPLVQRYSALETATYSCAVAVPITGLAVPVELLATEASIGPVTPSVLAAVAYLGVGGTAGAWYFWYKGLEGVDASVVSVFFFTQPVVGAALGATLLGERLGPGFVVGAIVMGAGVVLTSVGQPDRPSSPGARTTAERTETDPSGD